MPNEKREDQLSPELPTKDRETVQGGDYSPEGHRGGRPPLENDGSSPTAPSPKTVSTGGIPSAHPLDGFDAPDGDHTI